jgi:tRNA(Arg) A34 adenosine deaminase TadA
MNIRSVYTFRYYEDVHEMNSKHDFYVQEAVAEAKKCSMRFKHGCIIVNGTTIISRAHNSSERSTYNQYSVHAEVAAIENMNKSRVKVDSTTMYVVRINCRDMDKDNRETRTMNSRPCANCMRFISYHRIKKVYYTSINAC